MRPWISRLFATPSRTNSPRARKSLGSPIEGLEDRTTPAALVYVDDSWAAVAAGADPDGAGPATAMGTDAFATIQGGVNAADAGGTVTVNSGSYAENVTIAKSLTLQSASGRATTQIVGQSGVGALGAVVVTGGVDNVTIGGTNAGFTIQGIDNNAPGIENAAVYFQGSHSNVLVRGNDIVANGDLGMETEFSAVINNFTVDGNIFSGKTFVGANPAGLGSSEQFTLPNVPRQVVVISGGAGGGNTSNVAFTNNTVTATAGGLNTDGQEQGNILVTIDSAGATIAGNTFAGTTNSFRDQLRVRGPNTTITGNTFDSSGLTGALTAQVEVAAPGAGTGQTLAQIAAANMFDRGVFVDGTAGFINTSIQTVVAGAPTGSTVRVLGGTYAENVDTTAAGKAITLAPGSAAGATAQVTINGSLTLDGNDTLAADVNGVAAPGTDFDQFVVSGPTTLGGATLATTGTPGAGAAGQMVPVIAGAGAVTGQFGNAAQGAAVTVGGQAFTADYGSGTGFALASTSAVVTGTVFSDANGNNIQDGADAGVSGVTVFLDQNGNGTADAGEPTAVTGAGGVYTITTTATGAATVLAVEPGATGRTGTGPAITLVAGETVTGADAGLAPFVAPPSTTPPIQVTPAARFAVGTANGQVQVYGPDGQLQFTISASDLAGTGVPRVVVADVNNDGIGDVIIGSAPGVAGKVRVVDGSTQTVLFETAVFEGFTGGVFVSAGDLTGDTVADFVVTPDEGGGPRVTVFRGGDYAQVANFFGIDDPNFRGGARSAIGDIDRDGRADLVISAGFGGGPRVAFYNGTTITSGTPTKLFNDIFVFEQALRNGAYLAVGDVNGDGYGDLIAGAGPGGGPRVLTLSGADLAAGKGSSSAALDNFFAGDTANRDGIRVAAKDLDGDGRADIVTGTGAGAGSAVVAYDGDDLSTPFSFNALAGSLGGVFIG